MTFISYNHKANTFFSLRKNNKMEGRKKQYTASVINHIMSADAEESIPDCFLKTACNPLRSTAWIFAIY